MKRRPRYSDILIHFILWPQRGFFLMFYDLMYHHYYYLLLLSSSINFILPLVPHSPPLKPTVVTAETVFLLE